MPRFVPRDTMAPMKPGQELDNPYAAPQQREAKGPSFIRRWFLTALVALFALPFLAWYVMVAIVLLRG